MNNRKHCESIYDHLYKHTSGERIKFYYLCVYCGLPACEKDHVPPITRVSDYQCLGLKNEVYIKVPCCKQCNKIGGSELDNTFLERAERIKDEIHRRNKKYITPVEWDDDELEELDYALRTKVLENNIKSLSARDRIEYYTGIELILNQIDLD